MSICKALIFSSLFLFSACASFDDKFYAIDDAFKGDFRSLASAKKTTLDKLCKDIKANEVSAAKTTTQTTFSFPAIITSISKASGSFVVGFKDLSQNNHIGKAYTRSTNAPNEDRILSMRAEDRIRVTGTVNLGRSHLSAGNCTLTIEKASFEPLKTVKKSKKKS